VGSASRHPLPEAKTANPLGVFSHEAVMSAYINPRGWPTRYRFQYGRTRAYGSITEASEEVVTGNRWHHIGEGLLRLPSGTTFRYRVFAFNRFGSVHGQDRTFTTTKPQ
jgi:hypothetical protein